MCTTAAAETAADTIAVRVPIAQALAELQTAIDDIVLVTDGALRDAVRLLHRELGLVVEPSGAASLAALLQLNRRGPDHLVAIVISGGNLAPALFPT
jgi:threonine dehydratase